MLFTSVRFVVFFLVAFAAYWATASLRVRHAVLLVASLYFYGAWDARFVPLIFYVTAVAYLSAAALARFPERRKAVVTASIALQLGQLAFFKYTNFFLGAVGSAAAALGSSVEPPRLNIILPIGVSFYTFHGISYVVDVYRGKIRPQGPVAVALYIVFFPQLVAGPIVRADVFLPQLERRLTLDTRDVVAGAKLVTMGLVYKSVFADPLARHVDRVFADPRLFDDPSVLAATFAFYCQIYFDFAGYSLMAIGISRLFGFVLPRNFDFPYRATSIAEFWRRWHISLSSWLRDYLYVPLGGNRHGSVRLYRNLLITMLLGGLWHGASLNFVVWGGLHGVALCVHRFVTSRRPAESRATGGARSALGWLATQGFVLLAWVPFRATTFADSGVVLHALSGLRPDAGLERSLVPWTLLIVPIVADHVLVAKTNGPALRWPERAVPILVLIGLSFAMVLPFVDLDVKNFIYFQF